MDVLILGGTGFIGRALVPALFRAGHRVTVMARDPRTAGNVVGEEARVVSTGHDDHLAQVCSQHDAVINLAGAPLVGARWTRARRRMLENSRIETTRQLTRALGLACPRPGVLLSASAIGYYGHRHGEDVTESATPAKDFLGQLCTKWEAAAAHAVPLAVRVVVLRLGVVLGREGGALGAMLPAFQAGLGAIVGDGTQDVSWIHLHDAIRIITTALVDDRYEGPFNCVAPEPVSNLTLTSHLSSACNRRTLLRLPAIALRLALGGASQTLLASQRVLPQRLGERGFRFTYPTLAEALADLVPVHGVVIGRATTVPRDAYLQRRPPRYELRTSVKLDVPVEEAFAFFSSARNLGLITPAGMSFRILEAPSAISGGARIRYRLRIAGVPLGWLTRIASWETGSRFVDIQESGPYRTWWHEHTFRGEGTQTVMDDRVLYTPPFGVLGRMAHRIVIAPMLRRIFAYRGHVIRLRFGHG
ncbi:MAG: TIGR01777 family oxidoreductase [Vicinamibacterales bacterium]